LGTKVDLLPFVQILNVFNSGVLQVTTNRGGTLLAGVIRSALALSTVSIDFPRHVSSNHK
jgi:hypothetical protein